MRSDHLLASDDALIAQCEVDRYRASGPGGQHRNKTESAVRLRHRLTGVSAIGEDSRSQANHAVVALTEHIATLSDAMRTSQHLMLRIAEAQSAIGPALQRIAEQRRDSSFDDAARAHLRNIELYLQRLLADTEQGRAQSTAELRNDLRLLTRTVAALADEPS